MPANAALIAGTKTFSVTLNTTGSRTVTATDITDGTSNTLFVGERIREKIAAWIFLRGHGLNISLTVSVGVATLPDVAASAEELIPAADKAMYSVKDGGKNGIRVAGA